MLILTTLVSAPRLFPIGWVLANTPNEHRCILPLTDVEMRQNMLLGTENIEHPTLEHLTAVVLAGGLGMRLRAVVRDRPKVMAHVAGRPFLAYTLDQIINAGIKRVVICTGYLAQPIWEEFLVQETQHLLEE